MHNIKDIKSNLEVFVKNISKRNYKIDEKLLLSLDKKNRDLIQKKEKLEQEKKTISKKKDKTQFAKSSVPDLKPISAHSFLAFCFFSS